MLFICVGKNKQVPPKYSAIKINGKKEILSVKIAPEVVDPDDVETLEDLIVAAVNEAVKKVETISADEMQKITGSLGLPGMF